jgi:hypothetical protein
MYDYSAFKIKSLRPVIHKDDPVLRKNARLYFGQPFEAK